MYIFILGTGLGTCPCIENSIVDVETFKHCMRFEIEKLILNFVLGLYLHT